MTSKYHDLLLSFSLSLLFSSCFSAGPIAHYCGKGLNDTNGNTTLSNDISYVLADLVARASAGGFAISSYGGVRSEKVYGLAQCRGDVDARDCSACLADAARRLPATCPGEGDARVWYDYCFARYEVGVDFAGAADFGLATILINTQNATNPEAFDAAAGTVMGRAAARAGGAGAGFGTEEERFDAIDVTIYGLAQCTRDLRPLMCAQCLSSAVGMFREYCRFRQGCQVLYSSCIARYEIYPFYFPLDI